MFVLFIPFLVFDFWSLLATKDKNITQSLIKFCKARWKKWKENHATKGKKYQKPKDQNMGLMQH